MEDESVVRNALRGLRASQAHVVGREPRVRHSDAGAAAFLAFLVATVVVVVFAVTVSTRNSTSRACPAITYEFVGAPPAEMRAQFTAAADEITRATGLHFAPAGDAAPRLSVAWVPKVHTGADQASNTSAHSTVVGSGFGRWHTEGLYRVLDGAAVKVNSGWDWSRTGPAGANLRAVLIHELGHVVGLSHNADPSSYMYASTRSTPQRWTPEEQQQLKAIGKHAGC